jgi:hypothetical protein
MRGALLFLVSAVWALSIFSLCRRHQVAKPKGITMDDFAKRKRYRIVKDWAIDQGNWFQPSRPSVGAAPIE